MDHPSEDALAGFALGLLSETERNEVGEHLQTCAECGRATEEYREIVGALQVWSETPMAAVDGGYQAVVQRIRLHRILDQLLRDPDVRRQAAQNPEGVLAAHGIAPTPQLLAAFKDLDLSSLERFSGELDERITKLRRLLEWFPGASPGPLEG